jgi:ATP-dependent Clp protease ATP-binding subunit ClpC
VAGGVTTVAATMVRAARDEAVAIGSSVIGQEHVILAMSSHPDSIGGRALASVGVDPASIKGALMAMIKVVPGRGEPEPTPRYLRALEEADAEATEHGRPATSADLLLGILRTHQGVGFQLMGYAGITEDRLRPAVAGVVTDHPELADLDGAASARAVQT